ncbi:hypothetical protein [Herbaspirillum robiniae]|uniref:hypothetical protein n=1 Tax=Herbaspirillum robiniae TaxID=2014887 RepID=UPI003D7813A0
MEILTVLAIRHFKRQSARISRALYCVVDVHFWTSDATPEEQLFAGIGLRALSLS